jgi:hypothetical protein
MYCYSMRLLGRARPWIWALLFSWISFAADRPETFVDKGEGAAQVQEILQRVPASNSEVLGLLKIRSPEGPITEVPIKMLIRVEGHNWEDRYETQPLGEHPGEVLILRHHGLEPTEYFFGRYEKTGDKVQLAPLAGPRLYQPFAGSDFFPADLGLEFFHWPSQKIIKKEMRKSRSCRVIESINPNPKEAGYSRVLSWIDFETSHLIMAEAYDANDKLLKEFSVRSVDRKEGKLREIEMRNDQTDSRTRLLLNLDIDRE